MSKYGNNIRPKTHMRALVTHYTVTRVQTDFLYILFKWFNNLREEIYR